MNEDYANPDIWKSVSGFPRVMVSRHGDIVYFSDSGVMLLPKYMDELGYECVKLRTQSGSYISKDVCRLVAECFLDNPDAYEYDDITHMDGDLKNNDCSNLAYVNVHNNPDDAVRHSVYCERRLGRRESYRKPICCRNVTTGEEQRFESISAAEKMLGLTGIRHVLKGRRQRCKDYIFWYDE